MRLSLELVVIVIVLLVVALVVLTIFGSTFVQLGPLTEARNNCNRIGGISCQAAGTVPDTWTIGSVGPNGETCAALLPLCQCVDSNWVC
ncbi:MAG: hypothetical protein V3U72_01115 [Candidatus Aenigmarchaeota archaeon]